MTQPAVDLIIPALNEEASISLVLNDLPDWIRTVYVVDNGSTDKTADVARSLGAMIVSQPQRGYGAACLAGMAEIETQIADGVPAPQIVAFLDADYSDHPECIADLVQPIVSGDYDFVLGSRLLGEREPGAMPPQSYFGNKLACFLMRVLFGGRYTDLGPFRVIRYSALRHLKMADENFGWTIEMQIKATRSKIRTIEVPVPYRKRIGTSKISGTISGSFKAGVKILYMIAKYGILSWKMKLQEYKAEAFSSQVTPSPKSHQPYSS